MSDIPRKQTVPLLLFSISSFVLSYTTAIIFARALGAVGYDDYAVAVSFAVILSTLAEMGAGKFALRVMPVYVDRGEWSAAKGYLRFSIGLILVVSLLLAAVGAAWEFIEDSEFGDYATGIVLLFLPAMAWVGAGSEFVMANRAAIRSAFVTRLLVPGSTLVFAIAWLVSPYDLSPAGGVLCYGAGWLIGLGAVYVFLKQTTRPEVFDAEADRRAWEWLARLRPFLFFALLVSVLAKSGVVVLEFVAPTEATVAIYSAAAETGAFIYIVAKSTDKLYLPTASMMIERLDVPALLRGRRGRWLWLGSVCVGFLLVVFVVGRQILGLFGPEFVDGYPALCIIAVATCVWTMASLAPSFLKYVNRQRFVVVATTVAVLAHIGLCFPLGYYYGATGAAISYAIPVIALYVTMAIVANQELQKLKG